MTTVMMPVLFKDALYMHTWALITRIRKLFKNETGMRLWIEYVGDILGAEDKKWMVNVILFCCMSSWYSQE